MSAVECLCQRSIDDIAQIPDETVSERQVGSDEWHLGLSEQRLPIMEFPTAAIRGRSHPSRYSLAPDKHAAAAADSSNAVDPEYVRRRHEWRVTSPTTVRDAGHGYVSATAGINLLTAAVECGSSLLTLVLGEP